MRFPSAVALVAAAALTLVGGAAPAGSKAVPNVKRCGDGAVKAYADFAGTKDSPTRYSSSGVGNAWSCAQGGTGRVYVRRMAGETAFMVRFEGISDQPGGPLVAMATSREFDVTPAPGLSIEVQAAAWNDGGLRTVLVHCTTSDGGATPNGICHFGVALLSR